MTNVTLQCQKTPTSLISTANNLYHFTSKKAVSKIVRQGLKANWVLDVPKELVGTMRGVWLTDNPQLPPIYSFSAEYRIGVAIPPNDVRLVHWRSILKERISRNALANVDRETPEWKSFYFYPDDINPTHLRTCERYASMAVRSECRKAHFMRLERLGIE